MLRERIVISHAFATEIPTDPFGKLWDCPNVLVADGGTFVSNPYQNPRSPSWRWHGARPITCSPK
jgi:hypothetical protein